MKILLSGVRGYIGTNLFFHLSKNPELNVSGYDIAGSSGPKIKILPKIGDQIRFLDQVKPDAFIHLGAQTDVASSILKPDMDAELNIISTIQIANYISEFYPKCHFIYVNSGGALYGDGGSQQIAEDCKTVPNSFYGLSKLTAEKYLELFGILKGLRWSSLALSNVYGPLNRKGIFFNIVTAIQKNEHPIIYGPHNSRDYVHVSDVTRAIFAQIPMPSNRRINIGSGRQITNIEILNMVQKIMHSTMEPVIHPGRLGEIENISLSNRLAKILLNWEPKEDMQKALPEVVASYQHQTRQT